MTNSCLKAVLNSCLKFKHLKLIISINLDNLSAQPPTVLKIYAKFASKKYILSNGNC